MRKIVTAEAESSTSASPVQNRVRSPLWKVYSCQTAPNLVVARLIPLSSLSMRCTTYPAPQDEPLASTTVEQFFDLSLDLLCIVGVDGSLRRVNPAFTETLGWTPGELVARPYLDFVHPDDHARAEVALRARASKSGSAPGEYRCRCADGSYKWLAWRSSAADENGLIYAVARDVTQSKQVAAELRASEARFAHIASNIPGMMYQSRREADGATSFPFISDGAADIYGVSPSVIQANPHFVFDVVHPDDRADFDASMASALSMRAPWRWAGRIIVDGAEKWLEGAARPQEFPDGATVWDGLLLDVTEAREAARRLEESENRYSSLFDHHPDAVFSLDTNGRFLSANPACKTLCGYDPQEMLGQPLDPLVMPEQLEIAYAEVARALGGTATTADITFRHKCGRRVEASVINIPVIVSEEIVGVFGIARDLTKQRELEAQLRQAQKMEAVGQLAGGVAHDFNNILTVIQGCSEFLTASLPVGDSRRGDVDMIRDAAARAATLTRQLLAFSRKQLLQPSVINLNECVSELQRMLVRIIGDDIILATDLASDLGFISADAGQLEQVIVNMTVNARDAMSQGGELRIATRNLSVDEAHVRRHPDATRGPHVQLSISDTGCGMDAATLSRVFEPFFTTKGPDNGTGLGLASAYGIIRQSSGHIVVTSAPGAGTTFDIYLPVVNVALNAPPNAPPNAHRAPAAGGKETILLVEDDSNVRALASRVLTRHGYTVIEAANGAEGLDTVRSWSGKVDLVITDAIMPVMNGGELAEALAAEYPRTRVLFMSGYTDGEIVRGGVDPRRAFLAKPFAATDLTEKVRKVLDS